MHRKWLRSTSSSGWAKDMDATLAPYQALISARGQQILRCWRMIDSLGTPALGLLKGSRPNSLGRSLPKTKTLLIPRLLRSWREIPRLFQTSHATLGWMSPSITHPRCSSSVGISTYGPRVGGGFVVNNWFPKIMQKKTNLQPVHAPERWLVMFSTIMTWCLWVQAKERFGDGTSEQDRNDFRESWWKGTRVVGRSCFFSGGCSTLLPSLPSTAF